MGLVRYLENIFIGDDYSVERTFQPKSVKYIRKGDERLREQCRRASYRWLMFFHRVYLACSFLEIRILEYNSPAQSLKEGKQADEEGEDDEEEEEKENELEQSNSKRQQKSRRRRSKADKNRQNCLKSYCLTVNNPFAIHDLSWSTVSGKLLKALWLCYLFYIAIKLFVSGFLKLKYDTIMEAYAPHIIVDGNLISQQRQTSKCALPEQIRSNFDGNIDEQAKYLESWLDSLGDPNVSLTGVGSVIACLFAVISILFFIGPYIFIFFLKYGAMVHLWGFLTDPVRMREKDRYDLNSLCRKIKNTLKHGGNLFDDGPEGDQLDDQVERLAERTEEANKQSDSRSRLNSLAVASGRQVRQDRKYSVGNRAKANIRRESILFGAGFDQTEAFTTKYDPVADLAMKREKFSNFVDMLQSIKSSHTIEPANLTPNYHKGSISFFLIFSILPVLMGFVLSSLTMVFMVSNEIAARIEHRTGQIECKQEMEGGVLIKNHIRLAEFETFDDEWAYLNYHGHSDKSYLKLFLIEAKYFYLQPRVFLSLIEYSIIFFLSTFWITLLVNLFVASHWNSLVWLNQIEDQVDHCSGLIENEIKCVKSVTFTDGPEKISIVVGERHSKSKTRNPPNGSQRPLVKTVEEEVEEEEEDDDEGVEEDEEEIPAELPEQPSQKGDDTRGVFKLIAVTYLNFELFRNQHHGQQKLSNFLLLLVLFNTLISLYFCYVANKNIPSNYMKFLLFEATVMVLVMNIYLISGSLLTAKMLELMKKITKMIVISNYKKSHREHNILELWRRQVMSGADVKKVYAASFLGIFVTFDKLITMNSWLVLLWMYLLFKAPEPTMRQGVNGTIA